METKNLALLTLGLAAIPGASGASTRATSERPNIVMILVDDLGLGDLSCQWAKDVQTPNIDRLFSTGVRLDNFHTNSPVSSPSRASLMTGMFPALVGVPGVVRTFPENSWGYFARATTLPEVLSEGGYNTALVGKWHLGLTSPNLPNERGFDFFHGFLGDMMDDYYTHLRHGNNYMRLNGEEVDPEGHATDTFTDWAAEYLAGQAGEADPFFLYLAYNAPHSPLQPPAEWLEKVQRREPGTPERRQRLIALIEHLDYNIGRFMQSLQASGQADNTLVIFASDNGGDAGSLANNGPTRGNKGDLFEGGINVPCALWQTGVFEGGRRVDNFVMLMDIFPTLCDMLGLDAPSRLNGISVLDALYGRPQRTDDRDLYWLRYEGGAAFDGGRTPQTAVRHGSHILLRNRPVEGELMFDLAADPLEQDSLPLRGPIYRRLHKAMERHYKASSLIPRKPPVKQ
jgi:arylsulfatase A-like enzyme